MIQWVLSGTRSDMFLDKILVTTPVNDIKSTQAVNTCMMGNKFIYAFHLPPPKKFWDFFWTFCFYFI